MISLIEEYQQIFKKINVINKEIADKKNEIEAITGRRNEELPNRIANLEEQLKKIDEYHLKIDGFRLLAEKNLTSRNALTIEAPPGYRVNLNRLRTWAMMIDPSSENDPYAQRVYLVAKCDLFFLDQKKEEFQARLAELKADLDNGSVDEMKKLEKEIEQLHTKMSVFILSEEFSEFADKVKRENEKNVYLVPPERYVSNQNDPDSWTIGCAGHPLDAGEEGNKKIKSRLGLYYDEKKKEIFLPLQALSTEREFAITVSCVPARRRLNDMDAGIRALLLNIIDKGKTGARKVYVIDGERQNSLLVGSLKAIEDSAFLHAVPRNSEIILSTLEQLVASFSDIDDVLDNYDTVIEYNNAPENDHKIQRSVVVLVGYPDAFEEESRKYIKKILSNYERYGISFVAVKISAETKEKGAGFGISEYAGEDVVSIKMLTNSSTVKVGNDKESEFLWYTFKQSLSHEYVSFIKGYKTDSGQKGTVYTNRINLDGDTVYTRGMKRLVIPYGVDSKDEVHSISFENENFAAYLMGASGSGKSTLLHTIITGIIRNYHPDDVELWLADFKMSEFAQYMDPLPPHVKYILLDESQELVFDLIDKLTEKMMERQRFFMQHRDMKKVENVPVGTYMPVIFVILDEFSIMSQVVAENESYKLKLQNLLAKGRALGIKFIFSSQTFTRGIAGLSATAKEQIQARIAMKNSSDEIVNTLELSAANKTEQVKAWMDALPPHYALIKYREEDHTYVNRLKVMYFEGNADQALEPQRRMINGLNSRMTPVEMGEYNKSANSYVVKNPVIVDGSSYKAFNMERIAAARTSYINESGNSYEGDVFLSLGDPRKMTDYKFITLSNESRENIALIGRNAESACVMSVIKSVMNQYQEQGGKVHVWTYARNRLYHTYKDGQFEDVDTYVGAESISVEIGKIKQRIQDGEQGNDLVIMLGMEQVCGDFELLKSSRFTRRSEKVIFEPETEIKSEEPQKAEPTELPENINKLMANTEEEQAEIEKMHESSKDLEALLEAKEEELFESGMSVAEIMEELEKITQEYMANAAVQEEATETEEEPGEPEAEKSEEPETEAEEEIIVENDIIPTVPSPAPYDATNDLREIIATGSRAGFHFMLVLNTVGDAKGAKADLKAYNHKLGFQMSGDDSTSFFGARVASKIPEHICQYSNGMDSFSFRPYLHKGVIWDSWDVDEKGNVLDPSNI